MIRAIYRDGTICPLDTWPADWREGQELAIQAIGEPTPDESLDHWIADVEHAAAQLSEEDHDRLMAMLAILEADSKG